MKQTNFIALTVMAFGLAACGGDDPQPVVQNPNVQQLPNTPGNGFGSDAGRNIVQGLQRQYGNIRTSADGNIGSRTLKAGTHSWQKLYNIVEKEGQDCIRQRNSCSIDFNWGGQLRTVGGLSNINSAVFIDYLRLEQAQYVDVIFTNNTYQGQIRTLAFAVDLIVKLLNDTFVGASNYWSYNTPSWNTGYYYPTYQPHYYYPQNGLNVGVGFSNGNFGLNFNLHRNRY